MSPYLPSRSRQVSSCWLKKEDNPAGCFGFGMLAAIFGMTAFFVGIFVIGSYTGKVDNLVETECNIETTYSNETIPNVACNCIECTFPYPKCDELTVDGNCCGPGGNCESLDGDITYVYQQWCKKRIYPIYHIHELIWISEPVYYQEVHKSICDGIPPLNTECLNEILSRPRMRTCWYDKDDKGELEDDYDRLLMEKPKLPIAGIVVVVLSSILFFVFLVLFFYVCYHQ